MCSKLIQLGVRNLIELKRWRFSPKKYENIKDIPLDFFSRFHEKTNTCFAYKVSFLIHFCTFKLRKYCTYDGEQQHCLRLV